MKKQKKITLAHLASVLVGLTIAVGVCVYAMLPWIVEMYVTAADVKLAADSYKTMLSLLYCVGIPVLVLLTLTLFMTVNIGRGRAFVWRNVFYLNMISLCSVAIALMFFAAMFFLNSIFPIIIFVVFILLSILVKVVADLFKTAIRYKEENELTI